MVLSEQGLVLMVVVDLIFHYACLRSSFPGCPMVFWIYILDTGHCFFIWHISIWPLPICSILHRHVHPSWLFLRIFFCCFFSYDTSSLISSAQSSITSIFTLMRMPPPSAPCAFSMSSIICLSLFIPQSTVRRLEGLGLSFSLSQFTFQICLFTPRATLPHLKRYLSSAECFRAVPHVNTRLFPPPPPLRKRLIHLICCWCTDALWTALFEKKRAPDPVIVTALFPWILR